MSKLTLNWKKATLEDLRSLSTRIEREISERISRAEYKKRMDELSVWEREKKGRWYGFFPLYSGHLNRCAFTLILSQDDRTEIFSSVSDITGKSQSGQSSARKNVLEKAFTESEFLNPKRDACHSDDAVWRRVTFTPFSDSVNESILDRALPDPGDREIDYDFDEEEDDGKIFIPVRTEEEEKNLLRELDEELELGSQGRQRFDPTTPEGEEKLKLGWKPTKEWMLLQIGEKNMWVNFLSHNDECSCEECVEKKCKREDSNSRETSCSELDSLKSSSASHRRSSDIPKTKRSELKSKSSAKSKISKEPLEKTTSYESVGELPSTVLKECILACLSTRGGVLDRIEVYVSTAFVLQSIRGLSLRIRKELKDLSSEECISEVGELNWSTMKVEKTFYITEKGKKKMISIWGGEPTNKEIGKWLVNLAHPSYSRDWAGKYVSDHLCKIVLGIIYRKKSRVERIVKRVWYMSHTVMTDDIMDLDEKVRLILQENVSEKILRKECEEYKLTKKGREEIESSFNMYDQFYRILFYRDSTEVARWKKSS